MIPGSRVCDRAYSTQLSSFAETEELTTRIENFGLDRTSNSSAKRRERAYATFLNRLNGKSVFFDSSIIFKCRTHSDRIYDFGRRKELEIPPVFHKCLANMLASPLEVFVLQLLETPFNWN